MYLRFPWQEGRGFWAAAKRLAAYDVVRILLGLVLLTAAALKGYQLATEPVAETSLFSSRWFLIGVVEFELFFGLWLLAGLYPRSTWATALLCFGGFACVSLYKALSGEASCGCFGKVPVNPWYTFTLDALAVAALCRWQPTNLPNSSLSSSRLSQSLGVRAVGVTVLWILIGAPTVLAMGRYEPAMLSEDGAILGDGSLVILEPEKWTGERFPLLPYIEDYPVRLAPGERLLRERLAEGRWIVVLYHHDCPECRASIPKYEKLARRTTADPTEPRVAMIEVPPYSVRDSLKLSPDVPYSLGRLNNQIEWFVETPVALQIADGRPTEVPEEWTLLHTHFNEMTG